MVKVEMPLERFYRIWEHQSQLIIRSSYTSYTSPEMTYGDKLRWGMMLANQILKDEWIEALPKRQEGLK